MEQLNTTVEHFLQLYINCKQNNWGQFLPIMMQTYNNTPHSSIKILPNKYNYRRNCYLGTQLEQIMDNLLAEYFFKEQQ